MRVAHITATFPPHWTGTGLVCYHNARELARRGHDIHVYTVALPGFPAEETLYGFQVHRLKPLFQIGNAPLLPSLLQLKGFDLIHLHYPFIFGAELIWMVSKIRHIPYVLTYHNDLLGSGLRRRLFEAYFALSAPRVFRGAGKLAAVSLDHAAACKAAPLFRRRWPDVVEISNGVDPEVFRPGLDGGSVRFKLGIPAGAKVITFVGALDRAHPFKGVGYLLRAFARLDDPEAVLLIIGGGDLEPVYKQLASRLGQAERTFFAGVVAHADLPPYYAAADLVILPSFPPESFGMVLVEAMACGRPVIAHNIPGVRSVVSDGQDGFLATPGCLQDLLAKVICLLENASLRTQMGTCGRAKVEAKYAWPKIAAGLEKLYQGILCPDPSRQVFAEARDAL